MQTFHYASALLRDIDEATSLGRTEFVAELKAELDKVKGKAVEEAHAFLAALEPGALSATQLSNGQTVPTTAHAEIVDTLGKLGGDVPAAAAAVTSDPIEPSIVTPPLAATPANLVAGDGSAPVKTPPVVVVPDLAAGPLAVATVVAPSAPEGDPAPATAPVQLDQAAVDAATAVPAAATVAGTAGTPVEPDADGKVTLQVGKPENDATATISTTGDTAAPSDEQRGAHEAPETAVPGAAPEQR